MAETKSPRMKDLQELERELSDNKKLNESAQHFIHRSQEYVSSFSFGSFSGINVDRNENIYVVEGSIQEDGYELCVATNRRNYPFEGRVLERSVGFLIKKCGEHIYIIGTLALYDEGDKEAGIMREIRMDVDENGQILKDTDLGNSISLLEVVKGLNDATFALNSPIDRE